jgi:hypothetical protein
MRGWALIVLRPLNIATFLGKRRTHSRDRPERTSLLAKWIYKVGTRDLQTTVHQYLKFSDLLLALKSTGTSGAEAISRPIEIFGCQKVSKMTVGSCAAYDPTSYRRIIRSFARY